MENLVYLKEIRKAHLRWLSPYFDRDQIYYSKTNYDMVEGRSVNEATKISIFRLLVGILRRQPNLVELNEPMMVSAWPRLVIMCLWISFLNLVMRSDIKTVFYTIENLSSEEVLNIKYKIPKTLARRITTMVLKIVLKDATRMAYGTQASKDLYSPWVGGGITQTLIPQIPVSCDCCSDQSERNKIVFLGSLERRKGLIQLMEAWDLIGNKSRLPLHILGKGKMEPEVMAWAKEKNNVFMTLNPDDEFIHAALSTSHALVMFSQREKGWREQVGLPILEGVSHGCFIIASDETGIASWLKDMGQIVLPSTCEVSKLADALLACQDKSVYVPIPRVELATRDQRVSALVWLHSLDFLEKEMPV